MSQAEGDVALTVLNIGVDDSRVEVGRAKQAPLVVRLGIGTRLSGIAALRHDPPTPLELENAIAVVEDEVMPLARLLSRPSVLVGEGAALLGLAGLADVQAGVDGAIRAGRSDEPQARRDVVLTIEQVEQLFRDLAAVAEGRPAASGGVPAGPAYAATVLILREFMHHLGFDAITLPRAWPQAEIR